MAVPPSACRRPSPGRSWRSTAPPSAGLATDAERGWQYFDLVLEQAGIARSPATDAALDELRRGHDRNNLWEDVPEGVRTSLARFRAAGLRLAVVSNANGTLAGAVRPAGA